MRRFITIEIYLHQKSIVLEITEHRGTCRILCFCVCSPVGTGTCGAFSDPSAGLVRIPPTMLPRRDRRVADTLVGTRFSH